MTDPIIYIVEYLLKLLIYSKFIEIAFLKCQHNLTVPLKLVGLEKYWNILICRHKWPWAFFLFLFVFQQMLLKYLRDKVIWCLPSQEEVSLLLALTILEVWCSKWNGKGLKQVGWIPLSCVTQEESEDLVQIS